jgi:hypothetical protein
MARILVVANETIGGANLLEAVRKRLDEGEADLVLCVPRTRPKDGNIIYDEFQYEAAQVRVDLARAFMREQMGAEVRGEVGDPDPYTATMDAIAEWHPDEIIVSTKPATISGWLRRDLVDRIREGSGLPVKHVVTDIDRDGVPFTVVLVIANRTASTDELLNHLREKASDPATQRHLFIVIVPQEGGEGVHAQRARGRLRQFLDRTRAAGLLSSGMIGDPDPYTAARNGLQMFRVDEVVVATFGAQRSGWQRADVVGRIRKATDVPVEHVIAADRATADVGAVS